METPQLSSPDSPTHDPPKSTSLLDLPPELFNMVVDNLLPPTMHNRFGMLEFEEGFKKPAKQDRKNFTALSMTCRAARELCYGAYKPKVVNSGTMAQQIIQYLHRYTYGREEAGNLGTLAESLKGQVFSEIRFLDVYLLAGQNVDQLPKIITACRKLKGLRYLGPEIDFRRQLPARLQYLEILVPGTDVFEPSKRLEKTSMTVETLVLVDRERGPDGGVGTFGDSIFRQSDPHDIRDDPVSYLLDVVTGVRRLILRVDPQFDDCSSYPLESDEFLVFFGSYADSGEFEDLEELVLDVKLFEQFSPEECDSSLFVKEIFRWVTQDERAQQLPKLTTIKIYIHLHPVEIPYEVVEMFMGGDSQEVAHWMRGGRGLERRAYEMRDTFMPRVKELQTICEGYADDHGPVTDLEVQVMLAPGDCFPESSTGNTPILHVHARYAGDESVEFVTAEETDAWEESKADALKSIFEEYKQNMVIEDFEGLSDPGDCLPEHLQHYLHPHGEEEEEDDYGEEQEDQEEEEEDEESADEEE